MKNLKKMTTIELIDHARNEYGIELNDFGFRFKENGDIQNRNKKQIVLDRIEEIKTMIEDDEILPHTIKVNVINYYLDMALNSDRAEYNKIVEQMKQNNYNCFRAYSGNSFEETRKFYNGSKGPQAIETKCLFSDQFNTVSGYRIHFWKEEIYDNKDIKCGQFIQKNEELTSAINKQFVCGYCGKRYHNPEQEYCSACMGSEYLKKDQLSLLELHPVKFFNPKRKSVVPAHIIEEFYDAQQLGTKYRNVKKLSKARQKIANLLIDAKKKSARLIAAAEKETVLYTWLLDNKFEIDIINNIIYYDHKEEFCFGWRNTPGKDFDKNTFNGAPYPITIKGNR